MVTKTRSNEELYLARILQELRELSSGILDIKCRMDRIEEGKEEETVCGSSECPF